MENDKLIRISDALAVSAFWGVDKGKRAKLYTIPAVDAVEVRHEEWMSYFVGCDIKTVCTNCGEQIPPPYMSHEYCSKCGARMDGRREEGDA